MKYKIILTILCFSFLNIKNLIFADFSEDFSDDYSIEMSKLVASDGNPGDFFGRAVDIDGEYAIVGSKDADHSGLTNAGAAYIPIENFGTASQANSFGTDFTVDHIAVHNNIAALSIGSRGLALYDISDPEYPIEKGVFPIGYTYMSAFWEGKLLVCSREGLQLITIAQ